MFVKRLLSGIIMLILAYLTIHKGGVLLICTLFVLSIIGMTELYSIERLRLSGIGIAGYMTAALYYVILYFRGYSVLLLIPLVIGFLAMASIFVIRFPAYELRQLATGFLGLFYVSIMLSYIYITGMTENGHITVWLIFLSAWGNDTCAYCVGMLFGRTKMTPVLSPKKSVEGAIGGIVGAGILGFVFSWLFYINGNAVSIKEVYAYTLTCVIAAAISVLGDLFASAVKRKYDIKDYGQLIPGHGGVLDRFDSIIFVAPVIYYVIEGLKMINLG